MDGLDRLALLQPLSLVYKQRDHLVATAILRSAPLDDQINTAQRPQCSRASGN